MGTDSYQSSEDPTLVESIGDLMNDLNDLND